MTLSLILTLALALTLTHTYTLTLIPTLSLTFTLTLLLTLTLTLVLTKWPSTERVLECEEHCWIVWAIPSRVLAVANVDEQHGAAPQRRAQPRTAPLVLRVDSAELRRQVSLTYGNRSVSQSVSQSIGHASQSSQSVGQSTIPGEGRTVFLTYAHAHAHAPKS